MNQLNSLRTEGLLNAIFLMKMSGSWMSASPSSLVSGRLEVSKILAAEDSKYHLTLKWCLGSTWNSMALDHLFKYHVMLGSAGPRFHKGLSCRRQMPSVISETPHISRQSYSHMQLQSYLKHGNLSSPSFLSFVFQLFTIVFYDCSLPFKTIHTVGFTHTPEHMVLLNLWRSGH